jgi:pilus assembly protein FimV
MRDQTYMLRSKKLWLTALAGWVLVNFTGTAAALGLGQPVSRAVLGEPLSVTVPVRLNAGEELGDECVAADVFYGDDKLGSSAVEVNMSAAGANQRLVRIKTNSRVNEPVFTVYLVVGCQTKITRKFVGFADPPGMDIQPAQVVAAEIPPEKSPTAASPDSPRAEPVSQSGVKTTALPAIRGAGQAAARPVASASARPRTVPANVKPVVPNVLPSAEALTRQARERQPDAKVTRSPQAAKWSAKLDDRAAPHADGSRLELDPAAADALVEPRLAMTGGMALPQGSMDAPELQERRAAAAALWAAMNASPEQLARDRQRMVELESRLARLQLDAAAASKKLQDMEMRVREAEEGRFNHPLIYALAGACALFAGALAWIFLRQRGQQSGAPNDWWRGQAGETEQTAFVEPSLAADGRDLDDEVADVFNTQPGALLALANQDGRLGGDQPTSSIAPTRPVSATFAQTDSHIDSAQHSGQLQPAFGTSSRDDMGATQPISLKQHEPVREMSVEELIDLEQQAEFFVVLGQDHAATELLESHVQSSKGASPLPYLKLLEIYQRLGQRDDYERVQQAFNQRFNAYAPSWESDLQQGHSLQDYPGVVERLQALWSQPRKAMEVLQHSLTRPDDTVETFDLPAYRELLMLYSVARDLSDRQTDELIQVDIDVPDMHDDVEDASDTVVAPLTATRPIKAEPKVLPALSVDFSLDDDEPSAPAVSSPVNTHVSSNTSHRDDLGPIEFVVVPDEPNQPKA